MTTVSVIVIAGGAGNAGVLLVESLPLLALTLAWAVVCVSLATGLFRWSPLR